MKTQICSPSKAKFFLESQKNRTAIFEQPFESNYQTFTHPALVIIASNSFPWQICSFRCRRQNAKIMMHITEICIKKQMVDTVEVGLHSTNKHTGNVEPASWPRHHSAADGGW